jgi:hypothetical protein
MTPVDMLDIPGSPVAPDAEAIGDCFRACVASIFDLKADDVPHFLRIDKKAGFHWTYTLDQWLAPQGLWYCDFPAEDKTWSVFVPSDGIYAIASGVSPRYSNRRHSVVVRLHRYEGVKMVHDPHPSRAGIVDGKFKYLGMFMSRRFICRGV